MQRAGLVLAIGAAFVACGGGVDDDGGGAFIARYCDLYLPCCGARGLPTDGRACRALFDSPAGRSGYNATAGAACLAHVEQAAASAGFCDGVDREPAACGRVFGSEAAPGSTCAVDGDCPTPAAGEVRCIAVTVGGGELRKCQVQLAGQEGSTPCVGTLAGGTISYDSLTGTDVAPEAYLCDRAAGLRCGGGTCVRLLADGAACDLSSDCADVSFCDVNLGTCAARKPVGASCGGQSLECGAGAYCDESALACAAELADGAACVSNVQCQSGNCASDACARPVSIGLGQLCGG